MGTQYQGAWQTSSYQGAWQQQAKSLSDTYVDSFAMSDGIALVPSLAFGDSFTIPSEALGLDASKVFADVFNITDVHTIAQGLNIPFSDMLPIADNLVTALGALLDLSDSFTIADVLGFNNEKVFADALNITDAIAHDHLISMNLADALSMSDSLIFQAHKFWVDTESISDSISLAVVLSRDFIDSLAITDSVIVGLGLSKAYNDAMTIMDNISKALEVGAQIMGLKDIALTLSKPFDEFGAWMPYIAIGTSDIAGHDNSDQALWAEVHRKEGTVFVRRNTYFVTATFGQDEPTADDLSISEIGIFDDPVSGQLGRRWVLETPVSKDNIDEIVIECAMTLLRGTVGVYTLAEGGASGGETGETPSEPGESGGIGFGTDSFGMSDILIMALDKNSVFSDLLGVNDGLALDADKLFSDVLSVIDNLSTVLTPGGVPVLGVSPSEIDFGRSS